MCTGYVSTSNVGILYYVEGEDYRIGSGQFFEGVQIR